jgi:spermidine/putrescine transport system permease protein
MTQRLLRRAGLIYLGLAITLVLAPLLTVVVYSFHRSDVLAFPPRGFTVGWYFEFFSSPRLVRAFGRSVIVGFLASALATLLGGSAGFAFSRLRSLEATGIAALVSVPFFLPPIVSAFALLGYYKILGLGAGWPSVVLAHTAYAAPLAAVLVKIAVDRLDWNEYRAGLNLGASRFQVARDILIPNLRPALALSFLLCFLVSWDEVLLAWYLSGFEETLPAVIYAMSSSSVTPVLNVAGVISSVVSVAALAAMVLWARRLRRHAST